MLVSDLVNPILVLCNQLGQNNQTTTEYKKNIPILADMGQRELIETGHIFNTFEVVRTETDGTNDEYVKIDMPSDFGGLTTIIDATNGGYAKSPQYWFERDNILYIRNSFQGTLRIVYRPCPTQLTMLTDTLIIDTNTSLQALVPYIASMLLLEENPQKSNYFEQKYQEQKILLSKRNAALFEPIFDDVDTSCSVN